jgi:hypothetical protein
MPDGIVHLVQRLAEHRGEMGDSGGDWLVQEPALALLLPLIHYAVPNSILPLSPAVRERCAQAYYHTVARNLLIYQELSCILEALHARPLEIRNSKFEFQISPSPIPTVVLKGAALALTLYPSIGLRPMGDIDLLVPQNRLAEAVACLQALGYVEPIPDMAPGLNQVVGHHVGLDGGEAIPLHVEVHWTLAAAEHDRHAPSMPWFWQQTEEWKWEDGEWKMEAEIHNSQFAIRNSKFAILTPTAHLLYLAAHLMLQHGGARASLLWFCDLDLLIRSQADRLDWDELLRRSREFHWAAALQAALQGAQERFGTPLPQGFLDTLAETNDRQAARLVVCKADPRQTRATSVWNFLLPLDWQARLRLALAIALPSPAYVRWRYQPRPGWLWPLCYPYRWLDILREGLSTLWQMASRLWAETI